VHGVIFLVCNLPVNHPHGEVALSLELLDNNDVLDVFKLLGKKYKKIVELESENTIYRVETSTSMKL